MSANSGSEDNAKTNLIVNYLPQSMTDEDFRVLFAQHGDIRSARIIRNKTTGYSYGFGFVEYFNPEDAERAIDALSGTTLNQKRIKVSYARPSSDEIKNANLYVMNLPSHYDENDVCNLFSSYGKIIQIRRPGNDNTKAFVLFNTNTEAVAAMKALNNHQIDGTNARIVIKMATSEPSKKGRSSFNGNGKPHLEAKGGKGLYSGRNGQQQYSKTYTNGKYRNTSHNNRYNPLSPHTQFYGGDQYAPNTSHGFQSSYVKMNQYYQPLSPAPHPSSHFDGSGEGEHILFVYNIGPDPDEFALGQLFSHYGHVLRVNVVRRPDSGESRGYGFVTMSSYRSAVDAINALNGYPYSNNKPLQVSFKKM